MPALTKDDARTLLRQIVGRAKSIHRMGDGMLGSWPQTYQRLTPEQVTLLDRIDADLERLRVWTERVRMGGV